MDWRQIHAGLQNANDHHVDLDNRTSHSGNRTDYHNPYNGYGGCVVCIYSRTFSQKHFTINNYEEKDYRTKDVLLADLDCARNSSIDKLGVVGGICQIDVEG